MAPPIHRAAGLDERTMIARIWSGATRTRDAAAYQEYMGCAAMPGYAEVAGNRMVLMLRRDRDDDRTEFTMVTLWADLDAVRLFTGPQAETAVFYPEDDRFLVERDRLARHHVVYGWHRSLLGWSRQAERARPASRTDHAGWLQPPAVPSGSGRDVAVPSVD